VEGSASKIGSSTTHRCCHADPIRTVEMPSGLTLPLASSKHSSDRLRRLCPPPLTKRPVSASTARPQYASMSAKSWPSIPGAPLLERTGHRQCAKMSSRLQSCRTGEKRCRLAFAFSLTPSAFSEHFRELLFPNLHGRLTRACVCSLTEAPLPLHRRLTRLQRYAKPSPPPQRRPGLSLTGPVDHPDHAIKGASVLCVRIPCGTCCRQHTQPGAGLGSRRSSHKPAVSSHFPDGSPWIGQMHSTFFGSP